MFLRPKFSFISVYKASLKVLAISDLNLIASTFCCVVNKDLLATSLIVFNKSLLMFKALAVFIFLISGAISESSSAIILCTAALSISLLKVWLDIPSNALGLTDLLRKISWT